MAIRALPEQAAVLPILRQAKEETVFNVGLTPSLPCKEDKR